MSTAIATYCKNENLYRVAMGFMDLPHQNFKQFTKMFDRLASACYSKSIKVQYNKAHTELSTTARTDEEAKALTKVFDALKLRIQANGLNNAAIGDCGPKLNNKI